MVSESQTIQVRIKFKKYGSLMYISQLDLAKTMQRIMVRAGIDIWYSEGFNPQPKIVFAVPLPVGVESECEYMDIKTNSYMSFEEIKRRLSRAIPNEMEILDVYAPEQKLKNVVYIDHEIRICSSNINENSASALNELFTNDIFISKKTKSGEKDINIKDYIYSFNATLEGNEIVIRTVLCAGSDKNLNPELIIEAIKKNTTIFSGDLLNERYSIIRKEMLKYDITPFA